MSGQSLVCWLLPFGCVFFWSQICAFDILGLDRKVTHRFANSSTTDMLILGLGGSIFPLSPETKRHINSLGIRVDVLDTRNAAAQFNLLATVLLRLLLP